MRRHTEGIAADLVGRECTPLLPVRGGAVCPIPMGLWDGALTSSCSGLQYLALSAPHPLPPQAWPKPWGIVLLPQMGDATRVGPRATKCPVQTTLGALSCCV